MFHNQVRIGKIQINPDWEYGTESPEVWAHVELDWVRLLDFETIRSFLITIATMLVSKPRSKLEWLQRNQQIDLAMIGVLWKTQEISRFGIVVKSK